MKTNQREIKFRAWDKKNMKMQYSNIVWGITGLKYPALTGIDDNEDIDTISDLMQYTGLKDKNDVEIYEGDLLETDINKKVFEVIYQQYSYSVTSLRTKNNWNLNETYMITDYLKHLKKGNATFEVIGNIYQNKELLN